MRFLYSCDSWLIRKVWLSILIKTTTNKNTNKHRNTTNNLIGWTNVFISLRYMYFYKHFVTWYIIERKSRMLQWPFEISRVVYFQGFFEILLRLFQEVKSMGNRIKSGVYLFTGPPAEIERYERVMLWFFWLDSDYHWILTFYMPPMWQWCSFINSLWMRLTSNIETSNT